MKSFVTEGNIVSVDDLDSLARKYNERVRHFIRSYNVIVQQFRMNELEDVDLRGRQVIVWQRNYDDSQWLAARNIKTVIQHPLFEGDDPRYPSYGFELSEDSNSPYSSQMETSTFWGSEVVLVVTER